MKTLASQCNRVRLLRFAPQTAVLKSGRWPRRSAVIRGELSQVTIAVSAIRRRRVAPSQAYLAVSQSRIRHPEQRAMYWLGSTCRPQTGQICPAVLQSDTPARSRARSGRSGAARQQNGFQRMELRPGNLWSWRYRSQKTRRNECPPHEAHQSPAALIGVLSQRSCAATVFLRSAAVQARK